MIKKKKSNKINFYKWENKMAYQNSSSGGNGLSYVSVIGSSVSALCFFAPWVGCSGQSISGADLGGSFWLVLLVSVVSLISFFFFKYVNQISKAKIFISICSAIGIIFLIYKYIDFQSNEFTEAFEIKWGGIATLLGFIISLIGVSFLKDEEKVRMQVNSDNEFILFCPNCGKEHPAASLGKFCDKCGSKL